MEYEKGLVSVVMPTYKRSEMLSRAIESVLTQTYKNIELLLVNDNEPDDEYTAELELRIKKYESDSRFRFILQEKHVNGAVARNVGIKQSRGEFIAFLDDDDWWEKEKIEHQVKFIETLPEDYGVVSCRMKRYNKDKVIEVLPLYGNGNVYKDIMMLLPIYATDSLLFRHFALDKAGYFDESLLRHQDLQLLVNFTYKYKLKVLNEFLLNVDVSDANNRPDVEKMRKAKIAFFKSVDSIYQTLSKAEQRQIKLMHRAELGYIQLKHGQYLKGWLSMMHLLLSPTALKAECKKFRDKKNSRKAAW